MTCDLEIPELYETRELRARIEHTCVECPRPIRRGELYLQSSGKWAGEFRRFRQHLTCARACMLIRDKLRDGDCLPFGGLYEYIMAEIAPLRVAELLVQVPIPGYSAQGYLPGTTMEYACESLTIPGAVVLVQPPLVIKGGTLTIARDKLRISPALGDVPHPDPDINRLRLYWKVIQR